MSRASTRTLSPTSYAILGLLAVRSWTPYELTGQMSRSFSRFWPRAQSKLYEEPKKLVAHGYASATSDSVGRKPRTRYHITPDGRRALSDWLARDSRMPVLEAEPLLRVFFCEHGRKDDVQSVLHEVRSWATAKLSADAAIARSYLEGTGQFPQRIAQVTLVGRYLSDFALMTYRWATWALEAAGRWPSDVDGNAEVRATLAEIAARGDLVSEPSNAAAGAGADTRGAGNRWRSGPKTAGEV